VQCNGCMRRCDDEQVRLQLWDIAGQDRFAAVTRAFYKNAVGAVVVCDVTRQSTLEAVAQWKSEIDSKVVFKGGKPVPAVLLVNKVDLLTDAEESFKIGASFEKMATECGFNSWYITSAKTDHNITEGMHFLIQEILAVGEEAQNALCVFLTRHLQRALLSVHTTPSRLHAFTPSHLHAFTHGVCASS
jgi:small GTP-binding protein